MRQRVKKLLTVLLCAALLVSVLASCDLFEKKTKVIAVERVESDGQTITVYYEDGFEYELNYYSVLSYQSVGISYFVNDSSTDEKEESTGEKTSEVTKEEGKDQAATSTGERVEVHYGTNYVTGQYVISGDGGMLYSGMSFGVRVMGTNENPMGLITTTFDTVDFAGSVSGGNVMITIDGAEMKGGVDLAGNGKQYEFYDSYLRDYVIAYLKEATVLGSLDNGTGGTVEVSCILSGGFAELTNLEKVVLPGSIKTIYSAAFYRCTSLKTIQYDGTVEQWKAIKKSADWDKESGNYTVYCTDGTVAKGE